MNRSEYFNYIEDKITHLASRIAARGRLNILDLNIHSETFFADFINLLLGINLVNLNVFKQNVEGIDLVDDKAKIMAQVSSTSTKQKIEASLEKDIFKKYTGYTFKFISISKDADSLRKNIFSNPHNVSFSPADDIIDVKTILNAILSLSIEQQKVFYEFIKKELGNEIDVVRFDTNLATIINILAKENLSTTPDKVEINTFEIDKKIEYNELLDIKDLIDDYKIFYHKLDAKYIEFDKEGANRSFSVFQTIKKQYLLLQNEKDSPYELFLEIVDNIVKIISESKNYVTIPFEELEMCAYIVVVDAFIRCKIFKNPEGYNHVITR